MHRHFWILIFISSWLFLLYFFFFVKYSVYLHIHGTKIRLLLHRTNSLTQTHFWMQLRMFDEQYRKSQKSAEYVLSTRSQLNFYISHKTFFLLVFPIQSVSFQPLLFITHQNCLQNYWKICIYKWRLTISWSLGGSLLILYLETKKKSSEKKVTVNIGTKKKTKLNYFIWTFNY